MPRHLELPFTITAWNATDDSAPDDPDAPPMAHVRLEKSYQGSDLTGTATGHCLTTNGPRGASYTAQERIVGTLCGRPGSFVLEHRASMGDGVDTVQHAEVVAGSGTGELVGLVATGRVDHELLVLDVELPGD